MRHLISIDDLTDDQLRHIVERGVGFATGRNGAARPLAGQVVGVYFRRTSTRTRTAFSSGALRLGAHIIAYGPDDLQTNTGETTQDTGKVFALMLDALVARTADDPAEMRGWADQDRMSVINAMSSDEHPTQALADLVTLQHRFGAVDGLRVLYVGEGNNTATALALALARFSDVELEFRTPPGYGLPEELLGRAAQRARRTGSSVTERHDMDEGTAKGFDVVYTTRWQTTGTSKPDPDWRRIFQPFQVTERLWEGNPEAVFMHDLPAHRGEEVTAEVLDGPASIAFEQAAGKLHSAMAVLEWCRAG
ncbi:ornithine carbamoyltransferase [Nonomuraea sp. NPDC049419]|uniref:ornithine carbamoyltransferase n=1 Tax=Nonomuraea sp. NPDC049419 TaxID=3155772 RepID=UPI00343D45E2